MPGLLTLLHASAYTTGAAYVGWLVGNHQCPAQTNFYLSLYGPVVLDSFGGFLGGLRGAPYHSNLVARLFSAQTDEDDQTDISALGEGIKGAVIGAASGLSIGLSSYGCGYVAADLIRRLF